MIDHYADAEQYLEDVDNGHAETAADEQAYALLAIAHTLLAATRPPTAIQNPDALKEEIQELKDELKKTRDTLHRTEMELNVARATLATRPLKQPCSTPHMTWNNTYAGGFER